LDNIKKLIREIPDFPKPGILFYDITTLLKDPFGFRTTIDRLTELVGDGNARIDTVVGMEARGFIFAPALAYRLGAGFVPVRKPKKLPAECERVEYELEYGTDVLEVHKDAIGEGHRVLIADDLLATGGTAKAVVDLVERLGGEVVACAFVVELTFLGGRERLAPHKVVSLLEYDK
jgi:adenine phosphoribosyltransferase